MRLDPKTTALLVIDLQNDTVQRAALDYALTTVATRATTDEVVSALS